MPRIMKKKKMRKYGKKKVGYSIGVRKVLKKTKKMTKRTPRGKSLAGR